MNKLMTNTIVLVVTVILLNVVTSHSKHTSFYQPLGASHYVIDSTGSLDSFNLSDESVFAPPSVRKQSQFVFGWLWSIQRRIVNRRYYQNMYQLNYNFDDIKSDGWTNNYARKWFNAILDNPPRLPHLIHADSSRNFEA